MLNGVQQFFGLLLSAFCGAAPSDAAGRDTFGAEVWPSDVLPELPSYEDTWPDATTDGW